MLAVVMAGGVVGVALREFALLPVAATEDAAAVPLATLVVNVVGSFLLGIVVVALGDRHPLWRAFAGTGMLGGFTTYSAFAVQSAEISASAPAWGVLLAVGAVCLGLAAAALGIGAARAMRTAVGRSV
tara:strand:- start:1621 stop:2004 length:384 start_codon:yes stop_codon:yes gene_type:complete